MLQINELETGYGQKQVLFGLSIEVRPGEIVALIGSNGAGKSTVLKAVCGLIPVWKGEVRFEGVRLNGSTPANNVSRGVTFCPQGNRVFSSLTVLENLEVGGFRLPKRELRNRIEEMFSMFPILKERKRQQSGRLSGGEQQMLALARALVPKPKLLLLDEPSLGLSPNLVSTVLEKLRQVNQEIGVTVVIVEQKVREVLGIAHRAYGMRLGKIVVEGVPDAVLAGDTLKELFLC
ncbi:MAG: ABC transporter ATP-binding protein [Thermoguttaceae bacterium]|jgi:branched-chain amino acid transport system ATP-binding protein